jgi:hypothetical protein
MAIQTTKLVLKTHWTKVLEVHRDWLASKGYTEQLLQSRDREGIFLERLKELITQAVANTLWLYRTEQFQIEITGHFERGKDRVKFEFHYALDPGGQKLLLTSLRATLDGMMADYPIARNTPHELPPAPIVYQQLATLNNNVLLHRLKNAAHLDKDSKKNKKRH